MQKFIINYMHMGSTTTSCTSTSSTCTIWMLKLQISMYITNLMHIIINYDIIIKLTIFSYTSKKRLVKCVAIKTNLQLSQVNIQIYIIIHTINGIIYFLYFIISWKRVCIFKAFHPQRSAQLCTTSRLSVYML
jgi:hypothetical protein